jgi:hypothetical protein
MTRYFFPFESYCPVCGVPLSDERMALLSAVSVNCQYVQLFTFSCYQLSVYTIRTRPLSVRAQYSRLCHISSSFGYNGSLKSFGRLYAWPPPSWSPLYCKALNVTEHFTYLLHYRSCFWVFIHSWWYDIQISLVLVWETPTVQNRQLPPCSKSRRYLYTTDCGTCTQVLPNQRQ